MRVLVKQPAEILDEDLWPRIALSTIVSESVARGLVVGAAAIAAVGSVPSSAGAGCKIRLSGGTDGERYLVTARATLSDGELLEEEIEVAVIDGAWAMPDGGAAYLTIAEFVRTFGLDEAIVLTDASGTGRIDKDVLVGALRGAQGIVDLNLGGRYALPLTTVPDVIKTAIADLARARLYPRGAPEGVATAAKDASRLLERIADGKVPLPIAASAAPAEVATDAPVRVRPGKPRPTSGCGGGAFE